MDDPALDVEARRRPTALTSAAVLVGLQGLVVVVLGVLEVAHLAPGRATMAVSTALFLLGYGAGLAFCAWGLSRCRSWARGPVVMAQLINLGLAWNTRDANPTLSLALTVVAVVTLVAVLAPSTRTALETFD